MNVTNGDGISRRTDGAAADRVYRWLRERILSGQLQPGDRLVEKSIAAATDVSRTPVREALHKLAVGSLVQDTSRGLVVATLSTNELMDMLAVRETLEAMACGLAAARRTDTEAATLIELGHSFQEPDQAPGVNDLVQLSKVFHETIWQMARNEALSQFLLMIRNRVEGLQDTVLNVSERRQDVPGEHVALATAIFDKDVVAAQELGRLHFAHGAAVRLRVRLTGTVPVGGVEIQTPIELGGRP